MIPYLKRRNFCEIYFSGSVAKKCHIFLYILFKNYLPYSSFNLQTRKLWRSIKVYVFRLRRKTSLQRYGFKGCCRETLLYHQFKFLKI